MTPKDILRQLADDRSLRIIQVTKERGRTAEEISKELGIPLSSAYRKIRELKKARLLFVERRVATRGGNICDIFRCPVREMKIDLDNDPVRIDLSLMDEPHDRIFQAWNELRRER